MSKPTLRGHKDNLYKKESEPENSSSSDDTDSSVDTDNPEKTLIEKTENKLENDLSYLKELCYNSPFHPPSGIYTPVNKMTMELFKNCLGEKIVKDLNNYDKYHTNTANKHVHQ